MRLCLIRHGDAVSGDREGMGDVGRHLTARGREEIRAVAARLAEMGVRFDGVLTSPLVRAVQTAEIVAAATRFEGAVEVCAALASGRWTRPSLTQALSNRAASGCYALVGHNPDVEQIAAELLTVPKGTISFQKGTVCVLELEREAFRGPARFDWMLVPDGLRLVRALDSR